MLHARLLPRIGLVALSLSLLAQPALAQWKWRDKNGRVTVSDIPPPRDVPDKDVLSRPEASVPRLPVAAASAASAPSAKAPVDPELMARKKAAEQEEAAKASVEAAKQAELRKDNCGRARSQVATMESGQRVVRMNEKGEREFLDDKQRADEARRARAIIASDCG